VLPNLIVIGAGKCGTTSLQRYLDLHPEVSMARPKELNFFVADLNWKRGVSWYEQHFDMGTPVRGEASVAYTEFPNRPGVPERMAALVPEARLVYLVRDPIERMVSSYVYNTWLGFRLPPFADAVRDLERNAFVTKSRYWLQLGRYLEHFPADRICVLDHDDLLDRREDVLRRVFGFLGVDATFSSPGFDEIHNRTPPTRNRLKGASTRILQRWVGEAREQRVRVRLGRILGRVPLHARVERPVVDDELRVELAAYFAEDVARLRAFTGQDFAGWSV
jgi:sulfotransferase family protein